jgi:hypothetical protein
VNPVASPHFNFTVTEPIGVVGVLAPDDAPLLALLTLSCPPSPPATAVVALASHGAPYPAILLGEMLATSDLPGGVVNLLTGSRADLLPPSPPTNTSAPSPPLAPDWQLIVKSNHQRNHRPPCCIFSSPFSSR